MTRAFWIQVIAIYWPIGMALAVGSWVRPGRREKIGLLFACAWVAGVLPLFDGWLQLAGAWSYSRERYQLGGMPLALYIGWIGWWGLLVPLLAYRIGVIPMLLGIAAVDFFAMPQIQPLVKLSPHWWGGEIIMLAAVMFPALLLAKWTAEDLHVFRRGVLLALGFGLLSLWIPALAAMGSLEEILHRWKETPGWLSHAALAIGFLAIAIGWSAMRDLALDGGGTPVPLDPTRRLVTTGIYGYVANPMQLGMTTMLLLEAAVLHSGWLALFAAKTAIYSAGFAKWSEGVDMPERFGKAWGVYQKEVRAWLPSLHLPSGHHCHLYVDMGCGKCSEVATWFITKRPQRLEIRDAADWPGPPLRRVTWHDPVSGRTERGVAAIGQALQHLHLGWAVLGFVAALPGVAPVFQICMDASGAAPAIRD